MPIGQSHSSATTDRPSGGGDPRGRRLLSLALALALTLVVAGLGALSVSRQVASFQPLGFVAEPSGGGWLVTEVTEPGTDSGTEPGIGVQPGDLILQAQGREVAGGATLGATLRSAETTELLVLRGDGGGSGSGAGTGTGEATLQAVTYHRPPLDVHFPFLVLALIGVVYLLIGFYTLAKDTGGRRRNLALRPRAPTRLFFLWCAASAAFYLVTPGDVYDTTGRLLYAGDMLARLFLPPLTLHLFLVFPSFLAGGRFGRRALPFLYLPASFLLLAQVDLMAGTGVLAAGPGTLALLDRIELAHLVVYALAAVVVLALRLRATDTPQGWEEHRQLRWVAIGMMGGYLPFVAFYALPYLAGVGLPELAQTAAVLPLALVPLTFAYAILRYKLWDIEVMVRDTVSYTLTLLLGVIGFSLANLAITRGLPDGLPLVRNVLVFLAGLGIAGVLVPAKRGISLGLERLQYRGSFDKRRALVSFGRDLLQERDLDSLCRRLLMAVEDAVDLERTNLYLLRDDGLRPVRGETMRGETGPRRPLPVDALGAEFWQEDARRLGGVSLSNAMPAGPMPLPAQQLYAAGYRYALPLTVHDNPVGMVVTGWKQDRERLTSDDVALLRQLLDQASLAIENAQLVDELQHRLDEVSQLQRYNEEIIESSPAGIAVLDGEQRILTANAGFCETMGRERSELTGMALADLLPAELPEPDEGPVETSIQDPELGERYLQLSTAPFDRRRDPSRGGGRILVVHDVTERVLMESAMKDQDRLAALGVMAAGVAHEVNTPLTGISSYAQMLLADTGPDDPRHEVLKKVERQTFRAAKIVNNLLDFARNRDDEMGPVDLTAVVEECLDLLRERLTKQGVRVEWQRPTAGEPVRVHGVGGELQQVVTNLVLNAGDAMEGGGTLTVTLEATDEVARLRVRDTGCGIPDKDLERIFEPFVTSKLGRGGTGLGLAISSDIVRHHGGDLEVESSQGEGSTFTLTLPMGGAPVEAGSAGDSAGDTLGDTPGDTPREAGPAGER